MKLRFNHRKWWHFRNSKSISIEIAGFSSHPSICIRVDGCEEEVVFHIAFFIGVWVTLTRLFPRRWYPTYISRYGYGELSTEREVSFAFHNSRFWWCIWMNPDEWNSGEKWYRRGCIDFARIIKGKHECRRVAIDKKEFILPFLEGNYNVEVIKYQRLDLFQRWVTRKSISYEVRSGYYEDGEWKAQGVPVEGKGENSWDCDEDATYEASFPGPPYNKRITSLYEAALYFWHSMMVDRERRASVNWLPKRFKDKKVKPIKIAQ